MANPLHQAGALPLGRLRTHDREGGMGTLEAAIAKAAVWLELDGVEGVAQGESGGEPCILVLASFPPRALGGRIPETFEGFRVVIRSASASGEVPGRP